MDKCELLSPAGNKEMLKYAIMYGADAVYLAGTKFGARKFAINFDDIELKESVEFAHLYGVKVYVTANTLIYEDEIEEFVDYIKYVHEIGVDAVLIQDFGMINLLRKVVPNLEIHASTQFHNDGKKTLVLLESLGVKRAVLCREMSLEEIEDLPDTVEKEVFCHGALCVSYSGQCLFSSKILNRSGNRGECAGLCRLPYKIRENGLLSDKSEYFLSLKDLCTATIVDKLLDAGVDSLKIEGRMKSPQYVGYMTKIYRSLIDTYYRQEKRVLTEDELKNIKLLFNRGITEGFLGGASSASIVNRSWPNHVGIPLGTYKVQKDKIRLELIEDLNQGDAIRFQEDGKGMTVNFLYDRKGKLINGASAGETVFVDNFLKVEKEGDLRKVSSKNLIDEIDNLPKRVVPIDVHFKALKGGPITLCVTDEKNVVEVLGDEPEKAKNCPITEENVYKQLNKTGNTVYKIRNMTIDLDEELFINVQNLNDLRRIALDKLSKVRVTPKSVSIEDSKREEIANSSAEKRLLVLVETMEQYEVAKKYTEHIFTTNTTLLEEVNRIFPKYPNCNFEVASNKYMISDYGSLISIRDGDEVFSDYMMNVTNSQTVEALSAMKVKNIMLSVELDYPKLEKLSRFTDMSKVGVLIYGRIELMKMKYSPSNEPYVSLVDRNDIEYPIKNDGTYNYLLSSKPINNIDLLENYARLGIKTYRLDFTDETGIECEKMLEKTHKIFSKE